MATHIPEGHLGNLNKEHEIKLQQLWKAMAQICDIRGLKESPFNASTARDKATTSPEPAKKPRFGFLRRGTSGPAPVANLAKEPTASNDDNKFCMTSEFQQVLDNQTPESIRTTMWSMIKHDHPDAIALRFLRARKWDVDKALIMMVSAMNWRRKEMNLDDDIMLNGEAGALRDETRNSGASGSLGQDFMKQVRMGKSFLHGTDRQNRPICYVRVRLHQASDQSPESIKRYTTYLIETARFTLNAPVDTANLIFDLTGFTLANMDYVPVKFIIHCFEANYPESLGIILVHNAPWVFHGIWRIIRGWLDPVVATKIHFTSGRKDLEEFIAPSQIIKELDGDENWEYKYDEPVLGENDLMQDTQTKDRVLKARDELSEQFEDATFSWITAKDPEQREKMKAEREAVAMKLANNYWELDPYIRSRSLYDRQGNIDNGNRVKWYPDHAAIPDAHLESNLQSTPILSDGLANSNHTADKPAQPHTETSTISDPSFPLPVQ